MTQKFRKWFDLHTRSPADYLARTVKRGRGNGCFLHHLRRDSAQYMPGPHLHRTRRRRSRFSRLSASGRRPRQGTRRAGRPAHGVLGAARCDLAACSFIRTQRTSRLSALQRGRAFAGGRLRAYNVSGTAPAPMLSFTRCFRRTSRPPSPIPPRALDRPHSMAAACVEPSGCEPYR